MTSAAMRTNSRVVGVPYVGPAEDVEPEVADHGGGPHEGHGQDRAVGRSRVAERGAFPLELGADRVVGVDEHLAVLER